MWCWLAAVYVVEHYVRRRAGARIQMRVWTCVGHLAGMVLQGILPAVHQAMAESTYDAILQALIGPLVQPSLVTGC